MGCKGGTLPGALVVVPVVLLLLARLLVEESASGDAY